MGVFNILRVAISFFKKVFFGFIEIVEKMGDNMKIGNRAIIREFYEEREREVVMKLEKSCNIGSKKGIFTFAGIMDDPFCRVRLFPIHVMLVGFYLFKLHSYFYHEK